MENHKDLSKNKFHTINEDEREFVMECVAHFHYRNGNRWPDGSMGDISMSPKEFNDILSYTLLIGKENKMGLKDL